MKQNVLFHPSHYWEGVKLGFTHQQMLNNIDEHARRCGKAVTWTIGRATDYEIKRLGELLAEARQIQRYRWQFSGWLRDDESSPVGSLGMKGPLG